MSELIINLLMFALPAGFLGSLVSWLFGRQKRNNDFIADLQESINLLTEENKKTLREVVELRRENATLLSNQETLSIQIKKLQDENAALSKMVDELNARLSNVKTITRTK